MTKEHEITPAMLRAWRACWLDERIAQHYAGRAALTIREIVLDPRVSIDDAAWVGVELIRSVGAPIFPLVDAAVREAVPMALASRGWHDLADRLRAIAPIVGRQTARAARLVAREVRDEAGKRAAAADYDHGDAAYAAASASASYAYASDSASASASYAYAYADAYAAAIRGSLLGAVKRCLAGARDGK